MLTEFSISENVQKIIEILQNLNDLIEKNPPFPVEPGVVRFGNIAYRHWFEKMKEIVQDLDLKLFSKIYFWTFIWKIFLKKLFFFQIFR